MNITVQPNYQQVKAEDGYYETRRGSVLMKTIHDETTGSQMTYVSDHWFNDDEIDDQLILAMRGLEQFDWVHVSTTSVDNDPEYTEMQLAWRERNGLPL